MPLKYDLGWQPPNKQHMRPQILSVELAKDLNRITADDGSYAPLRLVDTHETDPETERGSKILTNLILGEPLTGPPTYEWLEILTAVASAQNSGATPSTEGIIITLHEAYPKYSPHTIQAAIIALDHAHLSYKYKTHAQISINPNPPPDDDLEWVRNTLKRNEALKQRFSKCDCSTESDKAPPTNSSPKPKPPKQKEASLMSRTTKYSVDVPSLYPKLVKHLLVGDLFSFEDHPGDWCLCTTASTYEGALCLNPDSPLNSGGVIAPPREGTEVTELSNWIRIAKKVRIFIDE
jgi:hypothetical protein